VEAKNGARLLMKLSKDCGGEKPIREMASSAKAFLQGLEELYVAYKDQAAANPDKLPIVTLEDTVLIKTGSGDKQSTNYKPVFKITGWAPRGDLVWEPKNAPAPQQQSAAPATGSTRVDPPQAKQAVDDLESDFG
jgi:hypothetical protein